MPYPRAALGALLLAAAATGCASGRTAGPMVTDRPDFTESASTVEPGHAQVEAGYTYTDAVGVHHHEVGEVLARVGVGDDAELRLGIGAYGIEDPDGAPSTRGLTGTAVGTKVRLPAGGLAEEVAVIVATTIPVDSELGDPGWTPSAVLAAAWTAGPTGLGANLGYAHTETVDGTGEMLASVAAGMPLADRIGSFVELYGFVPFGGSRRLFADAGLTLTLSPNAQLDLRAGRSLVGPAETMVGVGVSVRR